MTFDTIRLILIMVELTTECDIDDYRIVIYSSINPLEMSKEVLYKEIPDCFNCNVHDFEINLDRKVIFIRTNEG